MTYFMMRVKRTQSIVDAMRKMAPRPQNRL